MDFGLEHSDESASAPLPTQEAFARSALRLPKLGLGAAHLGEYFGTVSQQDANETLDAAWRLGIRYFDTSPWYGHGLSERRVGNLLIRKDDDGYILSTKVGRIYSRPADRLSYSTSPWAGGLKFEARFDYSASAVMRSYEDSLFRIGVNRIDALVIHDLDRMHHADDEDFKRHWSAAETSGIKALSALKKSGDIKAVGVGVNQAQMIRPIVESFDVDFLLIAMPYTLIDQSALDAGFEECAKHGVRAVIGSPFASGILATGAIENAQYNYVSASVEIRQKVEAIDAICRKHRTPLAAAALQFPLAHKVVAAVIPGAVTARQVEQNVSSFQFPIPDSFWEELTTSGLIDPRAPTPLRKC